MPIAQLETFVSALMDIPNIRDIRLASKGLAAIPQHFLQDNVLAALDRLAKKAWSRGVDLAFHTHVNHVHQVTPLVGEVAKRLLEMGFRDVRNQGVLLRGVNGTAKDLLELSFRLLDDARIGLLDEGPHRCQPLPAPVTQLLDALGDAEAGLLGWNVR